LRRTRIAEVIIETEEVLIVHQRPNHIRSRCEHCDEQIEFENQKQQEENHVSEQTPED